MATNISHDGVNWGFQAGVIHGDIGSVTIGQTESLDQACLRDLRITNPYDDKERIKNTNGGLLQDSYRWIFDNIAFKEWQDGQSNRLLWIRGNPGKGKTMLLCGIVEEMTRLHEKSATMAFFFCQGTDERINSATSVLRGLIYILVEKSRSLLRHVRSRYDSAGKDVFEDINAWSVLVSIFTQILEDSSLKSVNIVIDALDECRDGRQDLLQLIIETSTTYRKTKWVVSSRNEYDIIERLDSATQVVPISLELNETSVSEAVNAFILHKVVLLAKTKGYTPETRDEVYHHLFSNSQGTFLWVALVWKNLDRTSPWHVKKKLETFPPGLDALYNRMMGQIRESDDAELCKQILGTLSTLYRPVTLSELGSLLEGRNHGFDDLDTLSEIIAMCGSFLTVRETTVVFVHQSARDFLLQEMIFEILPKGKETEHYEIFSKSLEVILKTLRRNVLDINHPGTLAQEISIPSPSPLAIAEYACIYWVDHLQASKHNMAPGLSQDVRSRIDVFLKQKFLHWLEAISILGRLSDGIQAMQKLEILAQVCYYDHEKISLVFNKRFIISR
ncbi:unnamed protein product [Penicillium salamii]|uniref:NACHT domain-containing protein n=1 Tax=Penicillium salamii TaxID=1612424 RepID=A0A9W4N8B0_9EURO|nr:unnamed protein product [Penicillium salamii]